MSISQHQELHDRINAILAKEKCHVHLAGILGVSMSALAEILLERGYMVTGSDTGGTAYTIQQALKKQLSCVIIHPETRNIVRKNELQAEQMQLEFPENN